MDYKDTVMGNKKIQLLGQQYEDELPTYDLNHYLLLAQAEISFKAGVESNCDWHKPLPQIITESFGEGKQAGIKEVVRWMKYENGIYYHDEVYKDIEAKLKEWGL